MLIKPFIKDEEVIMLIQNVYGLNVDKVSFLPLGADLNTAVYRLTTRSKANYFLKLRQGEFREGTAKVPNHLAYLGFKQIIKPLTTQVGQLWSNLGAFKVLLYPYIEGRHGMQAKLSDAQWIEFGATMRKFHSTSFPKPILTDLQRETFTSKWGETVKIFLRRIDNEAFKDPVALKMASFLKSKSKVILKLVRRSVELANLLKKQSLEYILCHADIHAWNLLIDKEDALYIVDWDTLILAPKERDLMFIGAGIGDTGRTPKEEDTLFYKGYGQTEINQDAISYYRYIRVIEDIAEYCKQIFQSDEGCDEDRMQSFDYLQGNFLPNGTIERAFESDITLRTT